jgi:hypothetical protein
MERMKLHMLEEVTVAEVELLYAPFQLEQPHSTIERQKAQY